MADGKLKEKVYGKQKVYVIDQVSCISINNNNNNNNNNDNNNNNNVCCINNMFCINNMCVVLMIYVLY